MTEKTAAQEIWPQRDFSLEGGRTSLPILTILFYSIIQIIRHGTTNNDYLLLFIGCILSLAGMMGFIISSYTHGATGRKSYIGMLLALGGFMPWLLAIYLVLIDGFGSLLIDYSPWGVAKAMAAIVLGYWIVVKYQKVTDLSESVTKAQKKQT